MPARDVVGDRPISDERRRSLHPGPPPRLPADHDGPRSWWAVALLCVAAVILGSLAVAAPVHLLAGNGNPLPAAEDSPFGATGQAPETFTDVTEPPETGTGAAAAGGALVAGIPSGVLAAYRNGQALLAVDAPTCHLDWSVLAGIGKVESSHARGGRLDASGRTLSPIVGPQLNGTNGNAAIRDTDDGTLDGDVVWDRAVGPSQFIPSTWRAYGADGDNDGKADPSDVDDAAYATGRYLCSGGLDLADPVQLWDAVYRYNHSASYVATVLSWARRYATGAVAVPDSTSASVALAGGVDPASILPPLTAAPAPTTTLPITSAAPTAAAARAATPTTTTGPARTTTLPVGGGGSPSANAIFDSRRPDGFSRTASQIQTENGARPTFGQASDGRQTVTFALPGGGKRSEIVPAVPANREGQEAWYRYRAVLSNVPTDTNRWQLILQWHQEGNSGSPPIALEVGRGHLMLAHQGGEQQSLGPISPNGVVDVVLHVRFSRSTGGSSIDVYRDGRAALLGYQPDGGTLLDGSNYLKFGLYRDPGIDTPSSLTVTDLVVARSAADLGSS